ncbi:hypothetical protein [Tissierella sp.]|uniref:hypothetical protein n=1 Tax=Tissierella sp. TaxID=41274 RepID=UPI0030DAF33C
MNDINEVLRNLVEAFRETWARFMDPFRELLEILEEMKIPEKKSYIPVKKIIPKKVILLSKRLSVHYCRNNC